MNTNANLSTHGQDQPTQPSESGFSPESKPSEQSEANSNSRRRTEAEQLDEVTALLAGNRPNEVDQGGTESEHAEQVGDSETEQDTQTAKPELPETFTPNDLAKQLGIKPKDLYDRLKITLKEDGETVTFGEWKDRVQEQAHAAREYDKREEGLLQREAKVTQDLQLIDQIGTELGKHLPKEVFAQAQQRFALKTQREQERMLAVMPELKDRNTFTAFKNDIVEHLSEYGFKPHELVIADHRVMLALKDLIATKKRLKRLSEFDPERERTSRDRKPQKPNKRQRPKPDGSNLKGESAKVDAIAGLISGKR